MRKTDEVRIKLIVCVPKTGNTRVVGQFLQNMEGFPDLDFVSVNKFKEVDVHTYEDPGSLILVSAVTKEDLVEVIKMMERLENDIREGVIRVVVFDQLNNEKLTAFFRNKGVSEIIRSASSYKTFRYKLHKHYKLLQQTVRNSRQFLFPKLEDPLVKSTKPGLMSPGAARPKKYVPQVVYGKPVEHFSDFWILTQAKNVRFINGKWFVGLYGPGPSVGMWEAADGMTRNGLQGWVFKMKDPSDQRFYQDEGRWFFFGSRPEFSQEERLWYFISKKPDFSFCIDKVVIHSRFEFIEGGDIHICHNSEFGLKHKALIDATMEGLLQPSGRTEYRPDPHFEKEYTEGPYQGRFSNDFEARKKHFRDYYECSELRLGLVSRNGVKTIEKTEIELIELRDKYVVLDAPAEILDVDDVIELEAFYVERGVSKQVMINAATQVVETEDEPSGAIDPSQPKVTRRSLVICELSDELEPQFVSLVRSFKNRREELNDFFTKAKGVA